MERVRLSPVEVATERIRALVHNLGLKRGDRLPSERVLSEEWGLSRGTIRSAIQAEEHEGRLERRPGSGTFVSQRMVERNLQDLRPFAEIIESAGHQLRTNVVKFSRTKADLQIADQLDIELGDAIVNVVRCRVSDGTPICVEDSLISADLVPRLSKSSLKSRSLYEVLEDDYGLQISKGYESLHLAPCPTEVAELLNLPEGTDVFVQKGVAMSVDTQPIEYFESYSRCDYVSFESDLRARPPLSATPQTEGLSRS